MGIEVPFIILIIAIIIYFPVRWFLKVIKIGNTANRKYIAIFPSFLLSPILYVGLILIWFLVASYYPAEDFDKEKWNTNIEERYTMSENIIESNMLIGKTKGEVISLLGNEYYEYSEQHMGYYIGFVPRLFNIDPSVLDIYFENGQVVKVEQHES